MLCTVNAEAIGLHLSLHHTLKSSIFHIIEVKRTECFYVCDLPSIHIDQNNTVAEKRGFNFAVLGLDFFQFSFYDINYTSFHNV